MGFSMSGPGVLVPRQSEAGTAGVSSRPTQFHGSAKTPPRVVLWAVEFIPGSWPWAHEIVGFLGQAGPRALCSGSSLDTQDTWPQEGRARSVLE